MSNKQLIYVDESGDTGFKLESGSSATLVVAATIFDSAEDAEATAKCIHEYRLSLGKGKEFQFHFSNLRRDWRVGFLRAVRDCPFRVSAVVLDKARVRESAQLRQSPRHLFRFGVRMLLTQTLGTVCDAKLFIDGEAGRASQRNLGSYLRRECHHEGRAIIAKVRFAPKSNVLIQLADMVAGGLARSYRSDKADAQVYRQIIRARLEQVWELGEGVDG